MQSLQERAEVLKNINIKYFHHDDFDKPSKFKSIMEYLPEQEKFNIEKNKVYNLQKTCKNPDMRPCYEEPLLTRDQEYHLFKRFNFLKFQCKKLIAKLTMQKITQKRIQQIEQLLESVNQMRNRIANSNFRLATYILRIEFKKFRDENNLEGHLSDAYLDIIKSVDYFNYNLGNKFSTYTVWVLKRNFFRIVKTKKTKDAAIKIKDIKVANLTVTEEFLSLEVHQKENSTLINRVIDLTKRKIKTRDVERQILIVELYFGINGKQRKNLEEISSMLCITKERVRQLKEKFLYYMREIVKGMELDYVC